jgi:hypothetical protein
MSRRRAVALAGLTLAGAGMTGCATDLHGPAALNGARFLCHASVREQTGATSVRFSREAVTPGPSGLRVTGRVQADGRMSGYVCDAGADGRAMFGAAGIGPV